MIISHTINKLAHFCLPDLKTNLPTDSDLPLSDIVDISDEARFQKI
jgi:hypothetical protein